MKVLVFGIGALGTVFATCLKADGHTVYCFVKPHHKSKLEGKEFKITGLFGEKSAVPDGIFTSPEELKDKDVELVILCVKAFDTEKALKQIKEFAKENTLILLAQNGYGNYEKAIEVFSKKQVILGRVIFGARVIEPGFAEVTVIADDVVIGQPHKEIPEEKLKYIAETLTKAGIPTRYSPDVYKILWDKILYNSALNPLGALLECNYGKLAEIPETKALMDKIIEEIFEVTKANDIELNWSSAEEYKKVFYEKLVPPTAAHYPSMYYDIKSGKKTEIDALNGAIVRLGEKAGIPTPVNEVITALIKAKENLG
ncbi:MAG: 2-dehydropantoate 2-reductase [Thermodesulfobacteria bacterium]|nr:2-dehydropantoate 2-reductase [Thermodesulfobacteriota bacterium]